MGILHLHFLFSSLLSNSPCFRDFPYIRPLSLWLCLSFYILPLSMCGISCIVALERQTEEERSRHSHKSLSKELDESLAQIRHRGPDSKGQWISPDGRVGPPPANYLRGEERAKTRQQDWVTFAWKSMTFRPQEHSHFQTLMALSMLLSMVRA